MRRPWLLLAALAAALALLAAWSCRQAFTWQREARWAGYQGEARRNPYLAAQRLLERTGHRVQCVDRLPEPLPPAGAVLVLPRRHDPGDPRTAARLARWVRDGGLLLAAAAPAGAAGTAPDALFRQFGVRVAGPAPDPAVPAGLPAGRSVVLDGRPFTVAVGARSRLLTPGHPGGEAVADLAVDRGAAVLAADLDCLGNDRIGGYDHPDFLSAVAGRRTGAPVWIVIRGDAPGLWAWLRQHAWPALAALATLALAALWAAAPRFGPLLPDPEPGRRSFLEHLDASGRYHWRTGRGRALLAAAREAFRRRLVRARPAWAALEPGELVRRLAGHAGLPPDRIDRALHRPAPHAAGFLEAIQTLRILGTRL